MDIECSECGSTQWSKILETDYPERRRERDRTVQHVYSCAECGAQGKRFTGGTSIVLSGAMR